MAWQGLQNFSPQLFQGAGLEGIDNAITRARAEDRQRDLDRAAAYKDAVGMQRQAAMDQIYAGQVKAQQDAQARADRTERGKAVQIASELFAKGDHSGALNVLRAAGISLTGQENVYGPEQPRPQTPSSIDFGALNGMQLPTEARPGAQPPQPKFTPPQQSESGRTLASLASEAQDWTDPQRGALMPNLVGTLQAAAARQPMIPGQPIPGETKSDALPMAETSAQQDQRRADAVRKALGIKYTLQGPGDEQYSIDTSERGRFQDQQRADRLAELQAIDPSQLHPQIRPLLGTVIEGVRSKALPPDKSMEDMFNWALKLRGLDIQEMNAKRPRAGGAITPSQHADDVRADAQLANTMLTAHLGREDYKPTLVALRETKVLLDGLESNNAAAQRRSLGIWAKQASGPGAVQQSERDEFVNTVGGKDMALRKKAMEFLSGGEVPPEQLAIFADAVKNITMKRQMETMAGIQDDTRNLYLNHPDPKMQAYADWAAGRVAAQFLPRQQPQNPVVGARQRQQSGRAAGVPGSPGHKAGGLADEFMKGIKF